jgi:hypothetical protein
MLDIGTPLQDALGGTDVAVASTGVGVCGKVLDACGFNVSQESGLPPAPKPAPVSDLVMATPPPKHSL